VENAKTAAESKPFFAFKCIRADFKMFIIFVISNSLRNCQNNSMLFGKLMLQNPNVLVMDEPTNHLDMESIEALNLALENYEGTLIFVSHDREFVSNNILPRTERISCIS
jgi:ABC-type uncharacterized transport system ATPase subunit